MITPLQPYISVPPLQKIVSDYLGIIGFCEFAADECKALDKCEKPKKGGWTIHGICKQIEKTPTAWPFTYYLLKSMENYRAALLAPLEARIAEAAANSQYKNLIPPKFPNPHAETKLFTQVLKSSQKVSEAFIRVLQKCALHAPGSVTLLFTWVIRDITIELLLDFCGNFSAKVTKPDRTFTVDGTHFANFPIKKIESHEDMRKTLSHYRVEELLKQESYELLFTDMRPTKYFKV